MVCLSSDCQKAFDPVPNRTSMMKAKHAAGFIGRQNALLSNWERTDNICQGSLSGQASVTKGVPQGKCWTTAISNVCTVYDLPDEVESEYVC